MILPAAATTGRPSAAAASLRRRATTCRRAADAIDRWKPALANEYLADAAALDRLADEHERPDGAARPARCRSGP